MAESLNLKVQREDGIGILTIVGYINNTGGEKIADSCNEMIEEGIKRLADVINAEIASKRPE